MRRYDMKNNKLVKDKKKLSELEIQKKELKKKIEEIIEKGLLKEASYMINEYEKIVSDDIEIYSIKGVLSILEGDLERAQQILEEGLKLEPLNYDLLYNLAYISEKKDMYITAYRYYKKIVNLDNNKNINIIIDKLKELENRPQVKEYKKRKKVLIIAYAFPPIGGSGIQRTLKFVNYLRDYDWEPIVLTVGESYWKLKDETLLKEIKSEVEVIRIDDIKIQEIDNKFINKLVKFYSNIINNEVLYEKYVAFLNSNPDDIERYLFIPEYQSAWAMKVCEKINEYIDINDIDLIYTSADPYADTFIGYYIKKKYNKAWVADFRDEWTNHHYKKYDKSDFRYKLEYEMEKTIVNMADKVITTTPISTENYKKNFNLPENKVRTITNGYDERDFDRIKEYKENNKFFSIMHNGIFHDGKNPITFLKALSNLINKELIDKNKIKVYFTREDNYVKLVKDLNLEDNVEYLGYLEHKRSLEIANKCSVLLLIVGSGEKLKQVFTGKIFEYLRLCKPILSLAPKEGVIDNLIDELNRGFNVEYDDIDSIEECVLKLYKAWESNKLPNYEVTQEVKKYERKYLTNKLSNIFNELLDKNLDFDYLLRSREVEFNNKKELESLQIQIKDRIRELINNNMLDSAKILLEEYKKNMEDDIEVYSMEAIIYILEENYIKAEQILDLGLDKDRENFDLIYDLAFLYEKVKKYNLAYKYYNYALKKCNDKEMKKEIKKILNKCKELSNSQQKTKMAFFDKGDDKFLWDIIKELEREYEIKKVTVRNYNQIDEWMEWADICWFEWCDDLIVYGSKHPLAKNKKIICRLHSYEAFSIYPFNVEWNNVDKLIFVADFIRELIINTVKLDKNKTVVIPNGVNLSKYKFANRKSGYNIAYVGYINFKKGPMLLLHTFKAIFDMDNRYKLYIAGTFQEYRYALYFRQMIKKLGLEKNVFFDGWQNDLDGWLEDKDYILCTSVLESQNMSVMQAMSKGIKPVIHNFVGAETIYKSKYIWNSIDEALKIIKDEDYDSKDYREFIENRYSLNKQILQLKFVVDELVKENINFDKNNIIDFTYEGKEIKFYLPNLNDWVQKVIYETSNFYEIAMLEDIKNRLSENNIIVDIGANIGNHTIFFSKICKAEKVYSFEPQKNIFEILKKNIELNQVNDTVELYNIGLGKEYCFANIKVIDENNYGMSKLDVTEKGNIEIKTLDSIIRDNRVTKIDLIKIDVEGMELEVLQGAKDVLYKFKPLIYIEAGTDSEFKKVLEFLSEFGYKPMYRFNSTPTYLFV